MWKMKKYTNNKIRIISTNVWKILLNVLLESKKSKVFIHFKFSSIRNCVWRKLFQNANIQWKILFKTNLSKLVKFRLSVFGGQLGEVKKKSLYNSSHISNTKQHSNQHQYQLENSSSNCSVVRAWTTVFASKLHLLESRAQRQAWITSNLISFVRSCSRPVMKRCSDYTMKCFRCRCIKTNEPTNHYLFTLLPFPPECYEALFRLCNEMLVRCVSFYAAIPTNHLFLSLSLHTVMKTWLDYEMK